MFGDKLSYKSTQVVATWTRSCKHGTTKMVSFGVILAISCKIVVSFRYRVCTGGTLEDLFKWIGGEVEISRMN